MRAPGSNYSNFLTNPYVLALIAVAGAFLVSALLVFGVGGGGSSRPSVGTAGVTITALTPPPRTGIPARSIALASIRDGPGLGYAVLGQLTSNKDVDLVGRNGDGSWFSIDNSSSQSGFGWVPKSALNIPGDSAILPVTSTTPTPTATIGATATARPEPTVTATPTSTPTVTPTPANSLHLVITIVQSTCRIGQRLLVNIRNGDSVSLEAGSITLQVQSPQGDQLAFGSLPVSIQAGQGTNIDTTYVVRGPVTVILEPLSISGDMNAANDRADCLPPPR